MSPDVDNIDAQKLAAEQAQMLLSFSAVFSESEEDSEDEEEDDANPELLKAIEAQVESPCTIEQSERAAASEFIKRSDKGDV